MVCTGEAGIGKTRLAEELAAAAAALDVLVVWARSADRDSSPPYGLWRIALQELPIDVFPDSERDGLTGDDLWSVVFGGFERSVPLIGSNTDNAQRFALFHAVLKLLTRVAEPDGLLIVLDDLQWADEPSLLLLRQIARHVRSTRMLILATCRVSPRSVDANDDRIREFSIDPSTERVELKGLESESILELLQTVGLSVSREQGDVIHAETGGNPFLTRELARVLLESPDAALGSGSSVPVAVRDATTHRIGRLADGTQVVLRAAAVAGNSFSIGVVAQMLGEPVLSLLDAIDECQAAGFLVEGDHPGEHRFSHALVRSAVVAQLSAVDQVRLHNAAADAIERLFEGQLRSHLADIARHRVQGSLPGDRRRAVSACEAAGDVASEDLAFEEAERLYREAVAVGGGEIPQHDRWRIELASVGVLHRAGNFPASHALAVEVGRNAERCRDRIWLARAAVAMEATGNAGWDSEICRMCEQSLLERDLPDDLRARVLARFAQALVYRDEYQRADEVSRRALDLAASVAATHTVSMVDALRARQLACSAPDGVAERSSLASRMLELADSTHNSWVEMWGRLWRIDTMFETGQLATIAKEHASLAFCVERVQSPEARWHLLESSATLAHATGRYQDALELGAEAYDVIREVGHPVAFGGYAVILSTVGMHIGFEASGANELLPQIPRHLAPDVDTGSALVSVFPALSFGLMCVQQGDREGARRFYDLAGPARTWRPAAGVRMACWAHGLPVATYLQRTDDIAYIAAQFEPLRGRHVANGGGPGVYLGPVELQLGKAATALGQLDPAIADLETAVAICDEVGAPGFAVEANVELAAALAERGSPEDRARASALLESATPEADRRDMAIISGRAAEVRSRLVPGEPASMLSPREREVAVLVGNGMTNKQIAESLYVSERTAQNHVQHILAKLGFTNRSQVAVWSSTAISSDDR